MSFPIHINMRLKNQTTDERDAARIVLCDYEECAAEVHLFCLGLKEVPGYTWFCRCKKGRFYICVGCILDIDQSHT